MGNFLLSDFDEYSSSEEPGDIVLDCREKVNKHNEEIEKLEEQIEEIEKKVEVNLSQNKDPFELMKEKLELVKRLEKLENMVDNLKDILKKAEDMMVTADSSKQRRLFKEIKKKKEEIGDEVFTEEYNPPVVEVVEAVKSNDLNVIQQEQDDIERLFSEN